MEPKKIALLIAGLAGFLTPFDLSAVNIALPTIASEFFMDAVTLGRVGNKEKEKSSQSCASERSGHIS
jgi:MFS family permease